MARRYKPAEGKAEHSPAIYAEPLGEEYYDGLPTTPNQMVTRISDTILDKLFGDSLTVALLDDEQIYTVPEGSVGLLVGNHGHPLLDAAALAPAVRRIANNNDLVEHLRGHVHPIGMRELHDLKRKDDRPRFEDLRDGIYHWTVARYFRSLGMIAVDRSNPESEILMQTGRRLFDAGESIQIYPQGRVLPVEQAGDASTYKRGATELMLEAIKATWQDEVGHSLSVLPFGIAISRARKRLSKPKIAITFAPPYKPEAELELISGSPPEEQLKDWKKEQTERYSKLIGEAAEHSRDIVG